ncbi:MAG: response regulator [Candidatus Acidiferrales bacterium]
MSNASHSSSRNQAGQAPGLGINVGYGDELFAAVFDSSAEALVIIDTAGTIQRANPRARELLHLKEPTRRSLDLGDFLATPAADQLASLWAPRQRPARPQSFDAALTTGFPVRVTLRWILPGTQHLLLCIEDGPVVRRAEAKSRHLEAELRSLLDSVHAGVLLSDPSGSIRFSNARFGQLFGLSMREVEKAAGMDALEELLAERFRNPADFGAPWRAYASGSGEPRHDELELTRPAGRVFERYSRPVLDAEGHPLGWLELYRDVTGERQIQSKMLQTEKMAALGQLVSGIAHELNNPLTAIMGYAQLMLGHGLNPNQFSEAKKVYQEAERARDGARTHASERERDRGAHAGAAQLRAQDGKHRGDVRAGAGLATNNRRSISAPAGCAESPDQRGAGAARRARPRARTDSYDPHDRRSRTPRGRPHRPRGVGRRPGRIAGDRVAHLRSLLYDKAAGPWDRAGSVDRLRHRPPTPRRSAFENQASGGAHFVVELPVVAVPGNSHVPLLLEPAGRDGASPTGRILVVEDEPTVAQLVVDVLREERHQAEAVLDSQEGLTRVSRGVYDLVICDLRMPRLDGVGFYDALVRTKSPIRDRIIFITGDTLSPRTHDFLDRNKLPYLAKPFLVEEIKLAVSRALTAVAKQGA